MTKSGDTAQKLSKGSFSKHRGSQVIACNPSQAKHHHALALLTLLTPVTACLLTMLIKV